MRIETIRYTVENTPTPGIAKYHVTRVRGGYQLSLHMAGKHVNIGKPTNKVAAMNEAREACGFGEHRVEEYFKAAM